CPWTRNDGKSVIERAEERGERKITDLLRRQLDDFIERDSEFIAKGESGVWAYYRHPGQAYQARCDHDKADGDLREEKGRGEPDCAVCSSACGRDSERLAWTHRRPTASSLVSASMARRWALRSASWRSFHEPPRRTCFELSFSPQLPPSEGAPV